MWQRVSLVIEFATRRLSSCFLAPDFVYIAPNMGTCQLTPTMRIISRKTIRLFWEKSQHADAEQALKAWFCEASNADWATPAEIKLLLATRVLSATTVWFLIFVETNIG
jgi:hypothetical protein